MAPVGVLVIVTLGLWAPSYAWAVPGQEPWAPSPLTPREAEVLAIAQQDRPIREVARVVFLSPGTVRNYLATITQKLEAGSRAEAYRIARENGWI
jgi:DNA-binding CsgD family transcriptional regulator